MITYQIPLVTYPDTYNKELLMYAAPASQKNRTAVYLSSIYAFEATAATFEEQYRAPARDMTWENRAFVSGGSTTCRWISSAGPSPPTPVDAFIARFEQARAIRRRG